MHTRETPLFYSKDKVKIKCSQVMSYQAQIVISNGEAEVRINASLKVCKKLKKRLSRFLNSVDM